MGLTRVLLSDSIYAKNKWLRFFYHRGRSDGSRDYGVFQSKDPYEVKKVVKIPNLIGHYRL